MKKDIKFGTDGWRGTIGFDFIREKTDLISAGVSKFLLDKSGSSNLPGKTPKVVIGYDTRFLSDRFAGAAAEVLCSNGIETLLSGSYLTTPALSYAVVKNNADLGIMITASHNPYFYNGYKIKGSFGGSATMDIIEPLENEINALSSNPGLLKQLTVKKEQHPVKKECMILDFLDDYRDFMLGFVDTDAIRNNLDFPVLADPMYGASQGLLKSIIESMSSSEVFEIHGNINPSFGSLNPEPIGDNLSEAISCLKEKNCKIAFCLDGDGDRIGVIGENGNFVSSHHIFAIILDDILKKGKPSGKVVKTVSTSSIIDRICIKHGLELITTPVGFKYINSMILSDNIIMGGEESGGLWSSPYIPERDGIMISLRLLEIICKNNKSINEILKDIYNKYGYFIYRRKDYEVELSRRNSLKSLLSSKVPPLLKNEGATNPVTIDGYKYFFQDGSWLMIRPSGTESMVRIYAESDTNEKLDFFAFTWKKAA